MIIILLVHDDGDITAVSDWNGAIKAFPNLSHAQNFADTIPKEFETILVDVGAPGNKK